MRGMSLGIAEKSISETGRGVTAPFSMTETLNSRPSMNASTRIGCL